MLKVSNNPCPRFPVNRPLVDDLGKWWVVRVKPRAEKALARELAREGVGYYLPMFTKRTIRRDSNKPRKSVMCLFPGYLSVADWPARKETILRTGRIINVIRVMDQDKFVGELENIRKALDYAQEVEIHPRLAVGQFVVIAEGPMRGVEGVIADIRDPRKIYLNVGLFGRAVAVKVSAEYLAPLEERLLLNPTADRSSATI